MDLFFPLLFLLSVFLDGALQSGAFDRTEYCPVYFYPHDFFCMGGGGIVGKEGLYVAEKDDIKRAAKKHKKTVAILISLTGSNHSVIRMARYLGEATKNHIVGIVGPHHETMGELCHELVEIPNRDSLLSLDVISSFTAATYVLDIFFSLLLSKRYEEHARSSLEMLHHVPLLWDETS